MQRRTGYRVRELQKTNIISMSKHSLADRGDSFLKARMFVVTQSCQQSTRAHRVGVMVLFIHQPSGNWQWETRSTHTEHPCANKHTLRPPKDDSIGHLCHILSMWCWSRNICLGSQQTPLNIGSPLLLLSQHSRTQKRLENFRGNNEPCNQETHTNTFRRSRNSERPGNKANSPAHA